MAPVSTVADKPDSHVGGPRRRRLGGDPPGTRGVVDTATHDHHEVAVALSRIAQFLAATDPDRAARLLTDAERITDEAGKASALSGIAKALAAASS